MRETTIELGPTPNRSCKLFPGATGPAGRPGPKGDPGKDGRDVRLLHPGLKF